MTEVSDDPRALLRARFAAARDALAAPAAPSSTQDDPVPLSAVQRRLWFLAQRDPGSAAYHVPLVFRLTGPLDEPALLGAIRGLAARHRVLRGIIDGDAVRFASPDEVPVSVVDIAGPELAAALNAEAARPFTLTETPPMRAVVFRVDSACSVLALTIHHIATDGWSERILLTDLAALYTGSSGPPAPQYSDVVADPPGDPAGLDWWAANLADSAPLLEIPTDRPRTLTADWPGAAVPAAVPAGLAARIRALAADLGATPFMIMLAAWQTVLGRLARTDDVAVGVPHAGRYTAAQDQAVGCFLDAVVVRTDLSGEPPGHELIARVRAATLDAMGHAGVPFDQVVQRLAPPRIPSATPVYQVMLNVYDEPGDLSLPGITVDRILVPPPHAKLDLSLELAAGNGFQGRLEYRADLFDPSTAARLVTWFLAVLNGIVDDPTRPVATIPLSPVTAPAISGPPARSDFLPVHQRFEHRANESPHATAVVAPDGTLTYRELDLRANRLAHHLIARGVRPGEPVGILLDPGTHFPVALLGILKAGAAYLPLDTTYPPARIRDLLHLAGAHTLITAEDLPDNGPPDHRPNLPVNPAQLAHVIFTSGSTGTPQGVEVDHATLAHRAADLPAAMPAIRSFALVSTLAADIALTSIYGALLNGGTLHLPDRETTTNPQAFANYLRTNEIDAVKLTPTHLTQLGGVLPRKLLILGGEVVPWALVSAVRRARPDLAIQVHYGQTELTMLSLVYDVGDTGAGDGVVPLGRARPGVMGYVVDRAGRPLPTGVPGELVLGGPGVARGYAGKPELTAERFVADPGGGTGRWYRTGDLVRVREHIEFLGRVDDQVKIRGYRVEPAEVVGVLRALPGVADAVVLAEGDGLTAWVVTGLDAQVVRTRLRERLPAYLVPAEIVVVERFPLTANGKLDRAALPRSAEPAAFVPPGTPTERAMSAVWAEILDVAGVGARDDFFALGGHSFAATRMVGRLAEVTGCALPVRVVFERPVLADLAAELDRRRGEETRIPRRPDPSAPVRLSPAQERLWVLSRLRSGDDYNTSVALRLRGPLDVAELRDAVRALASRHEVLCTIVSDQDGAPVSVPVPPQQIPVSQSDFTDEALHRETTRPFDLDEDPPLRASVMRVSDTEHVLVITVHHIAVDAWSWTTILGDLAALYAGSSLAPLAIQYADVVEWERGQGAGELEWWVDRLRDLPGRVELPADRPRGPGTGWAGAAEPVVLPAELTDRLRRVEGCTPFMVLLTAWQALLARLAGTEDVPVGVPVSGRHRPGTDAMVGCLVNTLVLRGDLYGDPTVAEALRRTRSAVLDALAHAAAPFEQLVERLRPERDVDSTPLFQSLFNVVDLPPLPGSFAGLAAEEIATPRETAQFDLNLTLFQVGTTFTGSLAYRSGLFDRDTVQRWVRWFIALVDNMITNPNVPILALAMPGSTLTGPPLPADRPATVVDAVLHQASRRPDATAVIDAQGTLSYAELAQSSGQVAAGLIAKGVRPGDVVGVRLPRDQRLPIALLGVLRAGAAYLPLDPDDPPARHAELTADAGVDVIIDELALHSGPTRTPTPDSTAYVLYTSGSTGRPKGVPVTHANLAAFVAAMLVEPGMTPDDVTLGEVPYTFDVFGYELWVTLAAGARLALADRETTMDGHALAGWIDRTGVTAATATPTTLRLLLAADWAGRPLRMISIGELLDPALAEQLTGRLGELWNAYGPTETTIYSTITRVPEPISGAVSIGGPIAGTRVHVMDRWGRPAPPGTVGELWISGAGVATGYLNRPELTAERFVTGPGGERCYRTGDLVRLRGNELAYVGRTDHQVKVRGHRIELGEIETVLRGHPGVADAVVTVAGSPGERHLVGYLVPRGEDPDVEPYLRERLPGYLIPHRWVTLESFPTTANGKVDRAALPEPGAAQRVVTPPSSLMEQLVARTWAEALGLDGISVHDDFFALGGQSLAATRVMSRLRATLGWAVPARMLFDRPVLGDLAAELERATLEHLAGSS